MKRVIAAMAAYALLLSSAVPCFADLQYTEESKITGGAAMGAIKTAGIFSKSAREATHGTTSTISLKGNRMRRDDGQGNIEIIDLDGRRIIHIDDHKKAYSILTFDEMRARLEEEQRKAAEEQAKHNKSKDKDAQVKIVPKISITPGKETKQLLGKTAKETKIRVDMEFQSTDPQQGDQSGNMWVTSDAWHAPVKGYDELQRFYLRLAKELNWLPGTVFAGNARIAPAMVEYRKDAMKVEGMPLLQYVSVGGASTGAPPQSDNKDAQSGNPVTRGIGGIFGRKKKKDDDAAQNSESGAPPKSPSGSLMDMTIEVKSVSTDTVSAGLFDIPQGYKQVQDKGEGKH